MGQSSIMVLPKQDKLYIPDPDAGEGQTGCVLLQEQGFLKDYRPIWY